MFFDTHFHLDLVKDPKSIIQSIEQQRIYTIAVTNLPKLYSNTEQLCNGLKYIRPALGYHPELVYKHSDQLSLFESLITRTKYIGEIGLDNKQKTIEDYETQKNIFKKIISLCADEKNKVLSVHSRKAESDVINIIGSDYPGKIILHWYSGSLNTMETAIEYGFYFSINLNMTDSKHGRNIIKLLPQDRLLMETDGPFTNYLNEPCTPSVSPKIVAAISEIRNTSSIETEKQLWSNFSAILS